MKLELDDAVTDAIVIATIRSSMKLVKKDIKDLSSKKNLKPWQEEDLQSNIQTLAAMKHVLDYFGGNL